MTSEVFREFFFNEKLDFKNLGEDTIVIFDTNTLLNIYRYSNDTRTKLIEAINHISNNIWMPYQVGLEFNLNRRSVIEKLKNGQEKRKQDIHKTVEKNINVLCQHITDVSLKSTDAKSKKSEINDFIKEKLSTFNDELVEKVEELYGMLDLEKDLASEIAIIFEGRIGECYTQEQLNKKLKDAAIRYERKIPPGYEDSEKTEVTYYNDIEFEQKYGDLIVWNQILDKASVENINKVVFITDDNKEDWWYSCERKTIGPRAELKNEMHRVANADFYMLNANSFLNNFSESEETIDLIENEVAPKSRLDDPVFSNKLDSALRSLSNWETSNSLVLKQANDTEFSPNKDSYRQDFLRQELNELELKIGIFSRRKTYLVDSLQRKEDSYNMLVSDDPVPTTDLKIIEKELLKEEILKCSTHLDFITEALNKMRSKHADLLYEMND
ncbi:PIN-like domain-containing protein [Lysinibacillus sp. NPDC094403]|uniref:PIN-like domain-containing protein n=1 Tax=Lysinibacillus sp. NPDC094403 TaxID=3390581 RepID=UPI003CFD1359